MAKGNFNGLMDKNMMDGGEIINIMELGLLLLNKALKNKEFGKMEKDLNGLFEQFLFLIFKENNKNK